MINNNQLMQSTYLKDDLIFYKEHHSVDSILGDRLIVDPSKIDYIIHYINKKNVKSIVINQSFFKLDTLNFLEKIPSIEGLYLLLDNLDVSFINKLHNLKVLRINNINNLLDLSNFPNLQVLSFTHSKFVTNISSCKQVFWLWIDNYKKDNLIELKELVNLQHLNLFQSSIKNLEGIENLTNLKYIRLDTVKKLESLKGLSQNQINLTVLDIYSALRLNNYEEISNVKSLKQLELRKTGETNSISFIKDLPNLKIITLGLKVLDGQMSFLKGVEKVGFIDFSHYSHKMKDFK